MYICFLLNKYNFSFLEVIFQLTNFDFDGIINTLIFSASKTGKIRISMEVNADNCEKSITPHRDYNIIRVNSEKMVSLNIDLAKATNYFIQLFYKTNQKYSCTRTKVGKLLSIVAFTYACDGKLAFDETIYKYDNCGTAIREIMLRFNDREIYSQCKYRDDAKKISEKLNEKVKIPDEYKDITDLDDDIKQKIEATFREFGAYTPAMLGECLNPLVNYNGIANDKNEINLSKFESLNYSDFSDCDISDNTLIKFLLQ